MTASKKTVSALPKCYSGVILWGLSNTTYIPIQIRWFLGWDRNWTIRNTSLSLASLWGGNFAGRWESNGNLTFRRVSRVSECSETELQNVSIGASRHPRASVYLYLHAFSLVLLMTVLSRLTLTRKNRITRGRTCNSVTASTLNLTRTNLVTNPNSYVEKLVLLQEVGNVHSDFLRWGKSLADPEKHTA